ncbi:DNA-directed RNA polymerase subunit RPC12/RpoP [Xanthomonas arboricola]|uniref:hypothetical protein n=1 Tax=Xanthomonas sp. 3793 TaxID=3035312 RepID=UPI00216AA1F6|nr:hypothetical protein [Xanthomonas sp. 3793]MCS3748440.1 DNA-directed RNA polymerase subunit RPC12/RpoP [Xanthomonas sp. 3793]
MKPSLKILSAAWHFFAVLRITFFLTLTLGAALLISGRDHGIFVVMLSFILGYASTFYRCRNCHKHVAHIDTFWIAFAHPFATRCIHCSHPIRRPRDE